MRFPFTENTDENIIVIRGSFRISPNLERRKFYQAQEDLLDFQKEFASLIYLDRDQSRWL